MDYKKPDKDKYKKDWLDWWLSDDPPAPAAREELRRARVEQANTYKPRGADPKTAQSDPDIDKPPANVTININLSKLKLPKVKKPAVKIPKLAYKRLAGGLIALTLLIGAGLVLNNWHRQSNADAKAETAKKAQSNRGPTRQKPSFTPVAPQNKPELANFADGKTAYDGTRDTYSYVDSLLGTQLTVSEQPLPPGYGSPQQTVDRISAQLGATTPINWGGATAYMKTDPKSGDQTVVFTAGGVLGFINSAFRHSATDWKDYLQTLR